MQAEAKNSNKEFWVGVAKWLLPVIIAISSAFAVTQYQTADCRVDIAAIEEWQDDKEAADNADRLILEQRLTRIETYAVSMNEKMDYIIDLIKD